MLIKTITETRALFKCPQCGNEFEGSYNPSFKELYKSAVCPVCIKQLADGQNKKRIAAKKAELLATLDNRMESARFPGVFCTMDSPCVRHNAEFLWRNKEKSMVIAGETGAGKTSSAAFVMRCMMKERKINAMYSTWQDFYSEYVRAKLDEKGKAEGLLFDKLNRLDYLILDELAWRRGGAKLSPPAQELLFNIIDGVYCKGRKATVWIMGNLYNNAFEKMLDQPEPVLRRLQYRFTPVWFDCKVQPEIFRIYHEEKI